MGELGRIDTLFGRRSGTVYKGLEASRRGARAGEVVRRIHAESLAMLFGRRVCARRQPRTEAAEEVTHPSRQRTSR